MNVATTSTTTEPIPTALPPSADDAATVRRAVREGYGEIARDAAAGEAAGCCGTAPGPGCDCPDCTCKPGCGCGAGGGRLSERIGYDAAELAALPEGADLGLSCGNPTALAALAPGEVVLDLGSGAGFDVFLAGPRVGDHGRAIGVDMTADMVERARAGVAAYRDRTGLDNVEFRLGEIEHLPLADATVDVVISNCVVNLSPDKAAVWREVARVLRPGGRVAISDVALLRPLPEGVGASVEALVGCVAGAVTVDEHRRHAEEAGLADVTLRPKPEYVAALESFQDPLYGELAERLPAGTTPADYLTSLEVTARKPA